MRLSIHTDYALRMLISLGVRQGEVVNVAEIADAFGISRHHLIRVAQRLRDAGHVETLRGNGGGLRLARPPVEINVGAVVRHTENDFDLVTCFAPEGHCRIMPACRLRSVLADAMAAFLAVLDDYTVADLLHSPAVLRDLLGMPAG
jgi:Rrf2 family nitric oxide-sensitive transcriptional repressor